MTTTNHVRQGLALEYLTLAWNVVGVVYLAFAAFAAHSVALAGFGFDTLVEIGASTVVVWELRNVHGERQRDAMRLIGIAFIVLSVYLVLLTALALARHVHPHHSPAGIVWTSLTAVAMFVLAWGKSRTGRALNNQVLITEAKVTFVDGMLSVAVLIGLAANALLGWWWADPAAGLIIVYYSVRESREAFAHYRAAS
ncbi:MAG: cation transporter [Acidimicrobiales bacterium]